MHDGSVFFIELWNHHLIAGCATYRDFLELAEVTLNGTDIGGLVTLKFDVNEERSADLETVVRDYLRGREVIVQDMRVHYINWQGRK